jgi:glutamate-1-semialdehyde 2,1-aminomutase
LAAVSFTSEPVIDYRGVADGDRARLAKVGAEMIRRGVLVNLDSKFYISLAHTDDDIDAAVETFEAALLATA